MSALFLLLGGTAQAALVDQEICVSMDEDFADTWSEADYWYTHANARPLRGIRIVVDESTGANTFDGYAVESGSDIGCITVKLDDAKLYDITVPAEASVRGYTLLTESWSSVTGLTYPVETQLANNVKPNATVFNLVIPWGEEGFAEILASQFMFARLGTGGAGSWPGNTVYFLVDPPANPYGAVHYAQIEDRPASPPYPFSPAHIHATTGPYSDARKFTITHEVGHWIQGMNDEQKTPFFDMSASLEGCDGAIWATSTSHQLFQREFQSAAASEGFASFFSAVTFNRTNESDCVLQTTQDAASSGFNTDLRLINQGTQPLEETLDSENQVSCEGKPWDLDSDGLVDVNEAGGVESYVSARDWLADVHGEQSCSSTAPLGAHGNEYDWTRYFWDMRTDEGLSTANLIKLVDDADPHDWVDVHGNPNETVQGRIKVSAGLNGWSSNHSNQKTNGQDR